VLRRERRNRARVDSSGEKDANRYIADQLTLDGVFKQAPGLGYQVDGRRLYLLALRLLLRRPVCRDPIFKRRNIQLQIVTGQ